MKWFGLLTIYLLTLWGCGDDSQGSSANKPARGIDSRAGNTAEKDYFSAAAAGPDLSVQHSVSSASNLRMKKPKSPLKPGPLLYEIFKGHEREKFQTNMELMRFLTTLSEEPTTTDGFGRPRLVPDKGLWLSAKELVRVGEGPEKFSDSIISLTKKPIYLLDETGVFHIHDSQHVFRGHNMVIKYKLECERRPRMTEPNSVVMESWFMSQLAPLGLTTPVLYYSDALLNPEPTTSSSSSEFEKIKTTVCDTTPGTIPIVRYIISENVGEDLHTFLFGASRGDSWRFSSKIKIAGQMVIYLEKLHALEILHGDAHLGNWVVNRGIVSMIDFGRSKIVNANELTSRTCSSRPTSNDLWKTKWEMRRCVYSYRDDMIQAMFMVGIVLHGIHLRDYVEHLCQYKPNYMAEQMRLKGSAMFFDYASSPGFVLDDPTIKSVFRLDDLLVGKDQSVIDRVREQFARISATVSDDSKPVTDKPNYEDIKRSFAAILEAVDGTRFDGDYASLFHF